MFFIKLLINVAQLYISFLQKSVTRSVLHSTDFSFRYSDSTSNLYSSYIVSQKSLVIFLHVLYILVSHAFMHAYMYVVCTYAYILSLHQKTIYMYVVCTYAYILSFDEETYSLLMSLSIAPQYSQIQSLSRLE